MTFSPLETNRFSKKTYRLHTNKIDTDLLQKNLLEHEVDLLIMRIPAQEVYSIHLLNKLNIPFIVADTLVYYHLLLDQSEIPKLKNENLQFELATIADKDDLYPLILSTFKGYTNHYYSNPYLTKREIVEGYAEWTLGHIESDGKLCFIVRENGKAIAFAACSFDGSESEGVIFGVAESAAGRGIYTDLIRLSNSYFKEAGYKTMKVSTQIQNYTVQRVWMKEKFLIEKAYITIHINRFLQHEHTI